MKDMTWLQHFEELRKRILVSLGIILAACIPVFVLYDVIFPWLFDPLRSVLVEKGIQFYTATLFEAFFVRLKLTILLSIVITLPVHLGNACAFLFPGLLKREKIILVAVLISTFAFGMIGIFYGYRFITPLLFGFFLQEGFYPDMVGVLLNFDANIFIVIQVLGGVIFVMQLPVLLLFLIITGVVSFEQLWKSSRMVIVCIFIIAAFFTPPDVFSQILVAVPLVAVYLVLLGFAWCIRKPGKGRSRG